MKPLHFPYPILFSASIATALLISCEKPSSPENLQTEKKNAPEEHKVPHWSYEGDHGPEKWGELHPDWKIASEGKMQSPIDIKTDSAKPGEHDLAPNYQETGIHIVNNGHTVQKNYDPGSSLTIDGKKYDLLQFHFHRKSEHTVDGKQFDLECHLVHKNEEGNLLVVGILIEEGDENPFLSKFWSMLPEDKHDVTRDPEGKVNVAEFLPGDLSYYHYQGSLTTPPCTEGVQWYVLKTPVEASAAQITEFAEMFPNNFRPVQPLFDRNIVSK